MSDTQVLYLLRHAKAEPWYPGVNDFARPLCEPGIRHMERLATWAENHLAPPQLVLCSPAARTRETLDPLLQGWLGLDSTIRYEPEIYEATTGRLQSLAEAAFQQHDSVMMVGHNPGFEYLAMSVLAEHEAERIDKMATGSLAVIEFQGGWSRGIGGGRLKYWIRRADLD